KAQQARGSEITDTSVYPLVDEVLENPIRLIFLEIAAEAVAMTPFAGGGSGSFAWHVYPLWDNLSHGTMPTRPELVHNELIQSATDYGIIGAGLLISLFAFMCIKGGLRCLLPEAET